MDAKYLEKASLMITYPQLFNYIISNKNYNKKLIKEVKKVDWQQLVSQGYYHKNRVLYLLEAMYNGKRHKIGYYLLAISDRLLKSYYQEDERVYFYTQFSDDDIYDVVESWHNQNGSYANKKDKELMELLPNLKKEDRYDLDQQATTLLEKYTKGDLINIILNKSYQEPKRGEIK